MADTFGIDARSWSEFVRAVRRADKDAQRLLIKSIKKGVDGIVGLVKSEAGFSNRIPASVHASVTAKGVSIKAGGSRAPHAAAFEHGGQGGEFRHPVFGHRDVWVAQAAHPFLQTTVFANESKLLDAAEAGIDNWLKELGAR